MEALAVFRPLGIHIFPRRLPNSVTQEGVSNGVRSETGEFGSAKAGVFVAAINKLGKRKVERHIKAGPGGKLGDGRGLYLQVSPAGTPLCRVKYSYGGEERLFAIRQGCGHGRSAEGAYESLRRTMKIRLHSTACLT